MTLPPQTCIANFKLCREIGRGGSAVVYEAEDARLHRRVALKVFRREGHLSDRQQQQSLALFRREATIAASLTHPSIVAIHDIGEWDGAEYIAMELLEGETLRALVERIHKLPVQDVRSLVEAVGGALQHAHDRGIVHQDVKPANIFRLPDGSWKLADFGIAHSLDPAGLTQVGLLVGSPAYMAPEQIAGGVVDQRTDLFSLAVTAYEALCGRRPFKSDSVLTALHHIAHSEPDPVADMPEGIRSVLLSALAKDPKERFPDVGSFVAAFADAVAHPVALPARTTGVASVQTGTTAITPGPSEPRASAGRPPLASRGTEGLTAGPAPATAKADTGLLTDVSETRRRRVYVPWPDLLWYAGYLGLAALSAACVGAGVGAFVERYVDYRLFFATSGASGSADYLPYGLDATFLAAVGSLPVLLIGALLVWRLGRYVPLPLHRGVRAGYVLGTCLVALAVGVASGCISASHVRQRDLGEQVAAYNALVQRARSAAREGRSAGWTAGRKSGSARQNALRRARMCDAKEVRALQSAHKLFQKLRQNPEFLRRYSPGERAVPPERLPKALRQAPAGRLTLLEPR